VLGAGAADAPGARQCDGWRDERHLNTTHCSERSVPVLLRVCPSAISAIARSPADREMVDE
jgi:hypothetical protein